MGGQGRSGRLGTELAGRVAVQLAGRFSALSETVTTGWLWEEYRLSVPEIPPDRFEYRLVVDGHLLDSRLIFRGPLRVGDPFPLGEGGGTVTMISRDDDDGSYLIHVTPIV